MFATCVVARIPVHHTLESGLAVSDMLAQMLLAGMWWYLRLQLAVCRPAPYQTQNLCAKQRCSDMLSYAKLCCVGHPWTCSLTPQCRLYTCSCIQNNAVWGSFSLHLLQSQFYRLQTVNSQLHCFCISCRCPAQLTYQHCLCCAGGKRQKVEDDPRVTALREVTEETAGQAFLEPLVHLFCCSTSTSPVFTT